MVSDGYLVTKYICRDFLLEKSYIRFFYDKYGMTRTHPVVMTYEQAVSAVNERKKRYKGLEYTTTYIVKV